LIDIIPVGMGYAVITTKLLDIDILIRRGAIYISVALAMALIMAGVIVPIMLIPHQLTTTQAILISLLLGIVATFLFGFLRKGIEI